MIGRIYGGDSKKIFHYKSMESIDPPGMASLNSRGMIFRRSYFGNH